MEKARNILIENLLHLIEKGLIETLRSEGGFYIFIKLKQEKRSGWEIARILIKEYGLATVPGEAFGMEKGPYLRLSFGNLPSSKMEKASKILKNSLLLMVEK